MHGQQIQVYVRGVWEFGEDAPGARSMGHLSTGYQQVIHIREFRSLRQRRLGRGPRAFPRTTRAQDLWYYALVPWIYIHETV